MEGRMRRNVRSFLPGGCGPAINRAPSITSFNNLIRVCSRATGADKSAVAAINRALQSVAGVFFESSLSGSYDVVILTLRGLVECPGWW